MVKARKNLSDIINTNEMVLQPFNRYYDIPRSAFDVSYVNIDIPCSICKISEDWITIETDYIKSN